MIHFTPAISPCACLYLLYPQCTVIFTVYRLQPSCNDDDNDNYNICQDLVSMSGAYESWMEGFAKVTQKWESIIVGNLPSISSSEIPKEIYYTGTGYPSIIDDVYICATDASIDGEGDGNINILLGSAAPLSWRGTGIVNPLTGDKYQVTLTGFMEFDSADMVTMQATLDDIVFHEMGHVISLGTLWEENGLYMQGSGEYPSGTYADYEWKAISCSGPLPVELDGGKGTVDSHWDEDCLGNKILTGAMEDLNILQPVS